MSQTPGYVAMHAVIDNSIFVEVKLFKIIQMHLQRYHIGGKYKSLGRLSDCNLISSCNLVHVPVLTSAVTRLFNC